MNTGMTRAVYSMGGDSLGNTLWGQTKLSVYDDHRHLAWSDPIS